MKRLDADHSILIAIPVLHVGGTELHTLALARALLSAGARVQVCCYYEHTPAMVRTFQDSGVEIRLLELQRTAGFWHLFRALYRIFKKLHPDVVHVQYIAPGLLPVAAARAAGVPTVFATVHQLGSRFGIRERILFSIAAHLCSVFFCVSKAVEQTWFGNIAVFSPGARELGFRHYTIYNGIDIGQANDQATREAATMLRANLGIAGRPVIGVVARLHAEKGIAMLIRALPIVLDAVPKTVLLLVGDGPDRTLLNEEAIALGVASSIIWVGECTHAEVRAFYEVMDIVAVPSQAEGFGLSAAEAMAAGRAVIATRIGGLTELIEDQITGTLVSSGDYIAFAEALVRVLRNPNEAKQMGAQGRRRIAEHFSMERFAEAFVTAYAYHLKRRRCPKDSAGRPPPDRR